MNARSGSIRRKALGLALALLAIGGTLTFFLLRDDGPTSEPLSPETPATVADDASGEEDAADAGVAVRSSEEAPEASEPAVDPVTAGPPMLQGNVLGEGNAVEGAVVHLIPMPGVQRELRRLEDRVQPGFAEFPDIRGLLQQVRSSVESLKQKTPRARTDREGRYEFRAIPANPYLVLITADGWLFRYGDVVSLAAGATRQLDVTLQRGAVIEGRLVDSAGQGVGGANILATFQPPGNAGVARLLQRALSYVNGEILRGPFEAITAADGSFQFRSLVPGTYELLATKTGFPDARQGGVDTDSAAAVIYMGDAATIEGIALDNDDLPAAHVTLRLENRADAIKLPLPAAPFADVANTVNGMLGRGPVLIRTDANGKFRYGPLAAGSYRIWCEDTGFLPYSKSFALGWGDVENLGLVRLDRGQRVRGIALSESGEAVEGAQVRISPAKPGFMQAGTIIKDMLLSDRVASVTDAEGAFEISGLTPGAYKVIVIGRGFAPGSEEVRPDQEEAITVMLKPGADVVGIVVDAHTSEPIPEARLTNRTLRTRTDTAGQFKLEGLVGGDGGGNVLNPFQGMQAFEDGDAGEGDDTSVRITASAEGYLQTRTDVDLANPPDDLQIELTPAPRIVGRVLDQAGEPVLGALVRLTFPMGDDFPPAQFVDPGWFFFGATVSDDKGEFRFSNFRGSEALQVMVDHPTYARGISTPILLDRHARRGEDGEPSEDGEAGNGAPADGAPADGAPVAGDVTTTSGGEIEVEIVLDAAARIHGVVTDGRAPVKKCVVRMRKDTGGENEQFAGFMRMLGLPKGGEVAHTDDEGRYSFERISAGSYTLTAEARGFSDSIEYDVTLSVGDDRQVDLRIERGGEIRGVVKDAGGGVLPGVRLRLLRQGSDEMFQAQKLFGGALKSGRSSEDGTFAFEGLATAPYTVIAEARGYTKTEVEYIEPGDPPVEIQMPLSARYVGAVRDNANRAPIPHFSVKLEGEAEETGFPFGGRKEHHDPDGIFELADRKAGEYELSVRSHGYVPYRGKVMLASGENKEETIYLRRGGRLRGRLLDAVSRRPVANAKVALTDTKPPSTNAGGDEARASRVVDGDDDAEAEATAAEQEQEDAEAIAEWFNDSLDGSIVRADADGYFLLEGIPEGPQTVVVSHDDYIPEYRLGIEVPLGQEAEISVSLRTGLSLSGTVADSNGETLTRGFVFLRGAQTENGHLVKTSAVNPDGRFQLSGLLPGTYRVTAQTRGERVKRTLELEESIADMELRTQVR